MTLRITIQETGTRRALDHVELPVPTPPPAGPDGGFWKWVGPLPSADVDLGSGLTLVLRVIQSDSVAAREGLRRDNNGHAIVAPPPTPKPRPADSVRCPKCGKGLNGKQGIAPHLRSCDPKPKVTKSPTISCPTCAKEFPSANSLGPHRRMAHGYKSGNPRARKGTTTSTPEEDRGNGPKGDLAELAQSVFAASEGGPEEVDERRAIGIAQIIGKRFRPAGRGAEFGGPWAYDSDLSDEERAELHVLDGRLMAHRIVGRGRAREHFWVLKTEGVAKGDTVVEVAPAVEA